MKTSITFLKHNLELDDTINVLSQTDTDYIHVDIMDGIFVNNNPFSIDEITELFTKYQTKPLDIHLMVTDPVNYIESFKNLNVECITIHEEIDKAKLVLVDLIHSYNIKAGIAINPETTIGQIEYILPYIDYVIVMGVKPGAGGQKLIPETVDKVNKLKELKIKNNYNYMIGLDGGVNNETRPLLNNLDIIISGSYVCMSDNYQEKIDSLR